jgi:hypothetical protein
MKPPTSSGTQQFFVHKNPQPICDLSLINPIYACIDFNISLPSASTISYWLSPLDFRYQNPLRKKVKDSVTGREGPQYPKGSPIATVKTEIHRYISQYSARLSAHPNDLTATTQKALRRHLPDDKPTRFLV